MKGKITLGLLLGAIGAVYMLLIYPLLQDLNRQSEIPKTDNVYTSGEVGRGEEESITQDLGISLQDKNIQEENKTSQVCIENICFVIEIADTPVLRSQGLMNREYLSQDAGMLFVFDTLTTHTFRMKNTLIPLDAIWLDKNMSVVDTATMQPCVQDPCQRYTPRSEALYVLEINAGLAQEYDISVGDTFTLK